jgi:hypothetical protein
MGLNDIDPETDGVETIVRGFGRSFALKFPSAALARDFREEIRDVLPSWTDPRTKEVHDLKVHSDKPLFVRLRDRLFAELWKLVLPKVQGKHGGAAKRGQSRGKLWVIVDDYPLCLFGSRPDPDDPGRFTLDAEYENLGHYGASKDEANAWMARALKAVA